MPKSPKQDYKKILEKEDKSTDNAKEALQSRKFIDAQLNIKRRSLFLVILFSIITLGIYLIYWTVSTTNELRKNTKSAPNPWLLLLFLIPFVNIIAIIVYFWKYSKSINELTGFNTVALFLFWILVPIAGPILSQLEINKKAAAKPDIAEKKSGRLPVEAVSQPEKPSAKRAGLFSSFEAKKIGDVMGIKDDVAKKHIWLASLFKAKKIDADTKKIGIEKIHGEAAAEAKPKKSLFAFFRKKEKKEGIIEKLKQEEKDRVKKRAVILERKHKVREHLERAGLIIQPGNLSKKIFMLCILINLVISGFLIYHFSVTYGITWATILASIAALWVLIFAVILFIMWVMFYIGVDLKIFQRKVDIEEVLPDFLQLTAANIKAGMTIDRALWYAVRPRFGVLANEIETVAKDTMRGEDLKAALKKFADKYDSLLLKRSISILIEGIEAGGEIGTLLNKISINIDENRIMRQEMEANVTTYAIFISFATIAAAPVLFALSGVLIKVIANLSTSLSGITSSSSAGFALTFSGTGINYKDFKIFAIVSLIITSFFSSIIIATIKKGNAKLGFKYIPLFIAITVTLFLIADSLIGKLLGVFL